MTTPDIQQAREWAENGVVRVNGEVIGEMTKAAVEVIQSLPDQWIDAEKVRLLLDRWAANPFPTSDEVAVLNDVEALLAPPLPTLADMTPEERKACQWMQADVSLQGETLRVAITRTVERYSSVEVIDPNGFQVSYDHELVTPLPDLPRLEWPAQEPHLDKDSLSGMWADDGSSPSDAIESLLDKYEEHDLPRPGDVPPGEWWSVRYYDREWAGVRSDHVMEPWSIISMDGLDYRDVDDSDITLMFCLVPEIP